MKYGAKNQLAGTVTKIKRGTVMSRVSRARAALAEKLSGPHVVELPRKGKGMRRG